MRLIAYDSCDGLRLVPPEASARVTAYGLDAGTGYPMTTRGAAEFDSASRVGDRVVGRLPRPRPPPPPPAAATAATAAPSSTNTQEQGVGEPDLA